MTRSQSSVVVVGGGTAGWLSAAVIAAECRLRGSLVNVTLVESPDVATIGVGEGTWPSLRTTLQRIGLAEGDLLRCADASFKQGTCFEGWSSAPGYDSYLHPFSLPVDYSQTNLADAWLGDPRLRASCSFADFVTPQAPLLARNLAPKQASMPEYAFAANYGYHLDAGKFAELLSGHAVDKLGVQHLKANVVEVVSDSNGDIKALGLDNAEQLAGSLFVDCTGQRAILLGEHYGVKLLSVGDQLFNDRAIAVQVPHAQHDSPIRSATLSTATKAGWIWDIALQSRRGVGHVFSSLHCDEQEAQSILRRYVEADATLNAAALGEDAYRTLHFQPGYREQFWVRNCVGVGLSAGFVEPLEASAIALIEQSAHLIATQLPADRRIMEVVAKRFNAKMHYHWQRIIEFLKLHYVVNARTDSGYWQAHQDRTSWPASLVEKLELWQQQSPYHQDAPMVDELFPSASYQYVLYGLGFSPRYPRTDRGLPQTQRAMQQVQELGQRYMAGLVDNRSLIQDLLGKENHAR